MRKKIDDQFLIFNGKDGEFLTKICQINKKNLQAQIIKKTKEQYFPPKITLAFAPVKNVRIDFIASKATELGITKFQPIICKHSVVDKVNLEKFNSNIKEAAEQCERTDIPEMYEPIKLSNFLKNLKENPILILSDESGSGDRASVVLRKIEAKDKEVIIFVGPEGGFSKQEFDQFDEQKNIHKVTLGPRILRADTAIISIATLVQEFLGDFDLKPNFS
ncbi:MAG: 16S rRNA (uracil1498-N3)-methyltransferase [Rickettsiales bacterium]|jgi:16S rRNA (uracil1498-N3)-methyltransferase